MWKSGQTEEGPEKRKRDLQRRVMERGNVMGWIVEEVVMDTVWREVYKREVRSGMEEWAMVGEG